MITVTNNGVQQINAAILALGRDSDSKVLLLNQKLKEANDAIASINKILDGINKDADVVSVNGKSGIVTLDASDVGALPDTTVIPDAQVNSDWNATSGVAEILNKPNLASVATSGSYNDLSNKPSLATVATSGSYNDLSNKPTIPTATSQLANDSEFTTLVDVASLFFGGNLSGNVITDTYPPKLGTGQFKIYNCMGINSPSSYGQLLSFGGNGGTQVFLAWNAGQSVPGIGDSVEMFAYMRSWRDISSGWTAWRRFITS